MPVFLQDTSRIANQSISQKKDKIQILQRGFVFAFICITVFLAPQAFANEAKVKEDVMRDIVKIVMGDERLELHDTPNGPILIANIRDVKELSTITPLAERLDNAGVKNSRELLNTFQEIVRIADRKMADDASVPVSEFARYLSQNLKRGFGVYQGDKLLGEWQCHADQDLAPGDTVSFLGIFLNSTQAALFRPLSPDRVQVWLAPFKSAPSDALTFTFFYQNNRWWVDGICSSMRL